MDGNKEKVEVKSVFRPFFESIKKYKAIKAISQARLALALIVCGLLRIGLKKKKKEGKKERGGRKKKKEENKGKNEGKKRKGKEKKRDGKWKEKSTEKRQRKKGKKQMGKKGGWGIEKEKKLIETSYSNGRPLLFQVVSLFLASG